MEFPHTGLAEEEHATRVRMVLSSDEFKKINK